MGNPWDHTDAPIWADLSFGHNSIIAAQLAHKGFRGVIGYVSRDPSKNLTAQNVKDYRGWNLSVGLVYEDSATWMLGGAPAGDAAGQLAAQQAAAIGYPTDCTIFAAADFNVTPQELPTVLACYQAFARHVRAGAYGNSRLLDAIPAGDLRWQTNAGSWSSMAVNPAAHLVQYYNDPRAGDLAVDVNELRRTPVTLMGTAPPPPPPPVKPAQEEDDMGNSQVMYLVDMGDGTKAYWVHYPNTGLLVHVEGDTPGADNFHPMLAACGVGYDGAAPIAYGPISRAQLSLLQSVAPATTHPAVLAAIQAATAPPGPTA